MEELKEQIEFFTSSLKDISIFNDRKIIPLIGNFIHRNLSEFILIITPSILGMLTFLVFPCIILFAIGILFALVDGIIYQKGVFASINSSDRNGIVITFIGASLSYFYYKNLKSITTFVDEFTVEGSEYYKLKNRYTTFTSKLSEELSNYSKESKKSIKFRLEALISYENIEKNKLIDLIDIYQTYISTLQESKRIIFDSKNHSKNPIQNRYALFNDYLQSANNFIDSAIERTKEPKLDITNSKIEEITQVKNDDGTKKQSINNNKKEAVINNDNKNVDEADLSSTQDQIILTESESIESYNAYERETVIKVSSEYYADIVSRKIDVGKKGEYLALSFERQRILAEEGESALSYLEHSSKEIGDGLGYDITSIYKGKKVFIEVKTTTGSFWSNLIFTKNEFVVLNRVKSQYWIYRIYNFDEENNIGRIVSFRGAKQIESYFKFEPKKYTLKTKK